MYKLDPFHESDVDDLAEIAASCNDRISANRRGVGGRGHSLCC